MKQPNKCYILLEIRSSLEKDICTAVLQLISSTLFEDFLLLL